MNLQNSCDIKRRWEDQTRLYLCTEAHLATNSSTWREFKWKIITRIFRTQAMLSIMGPASVGEAVEHM